MMRNPVPDTEANDLQPACYADAVFRQQAQLFYRQLPMTMLGSVISSIVLVIIFYGVSSTGALLGWLALQLFLASLRMVITRIFFRVEHDMTRVRQLVLATRVISLISGAAWGLSSLLFFTVEPPIYPIALSIILFGTITATVTSYSSLPWIYPAYSLPVSLQLAWSFVDTGMVEFQLMAALIIVFAFANLGFSRNAYKSTLKTIELNLQNIELIGQLKQQKEAAEEASLAKSRFLAAASHDLRQPLQAMLLFIEGLSDSDANRRQEAIENIRQSSNALKNLFDELLDISRLDAGVIKMRKENFNIEAIIEEIYHDQLPLLEQKQQTLKCHIQMKYIYSDAVLTKRILQNLICNAIQYTPPQGCITVTVSSASALTAIISVEDNGPGIPQTELTSVFDEFHQLHNPERDRNKGLGLGLAIVKRLIRLLESEITVSGNQGCTFRFTLPLGKPEIEAPPDDDGLDLSQPLSGLHVLIIDDEKDIRRALQNLLGKWGCITRTADSIDSALQAVAEFPDCELILSDFRLRERVTGLQVIAAVHEVLQQNIPAILITGDTAAERIREAGQSGYILLHKPVKPAQLRLAISQALVEG